MINLEDLSNFAEHYKPNFESINYKQLRSLTKNLNNGEPIYLVLYKNYELAPHYFNDMAQHLEFKAKIYKSNDPPLFDAAGFYPKGFSDFELKQDKVEHNKMVYFLVYKKSTFFPSSVPLDRNNEIIEWIFHAHFPHVTEINNDNFYTVFHSI